MTKEEQVIIKTSSYTETFPESSCKVKVAIRAVGWDKNDCFKTYVYEDAIYDGGFVTIPEKKQSYLAFNFLFHKLKREDLKN